MVSFWREEFHRTQEAARINKLTSRSVPPNGNPEMDRRDQETIDESSGANRIFARHIVAEIRQTVQLRGTHPRILECATQF